MDVGQLEWAGVFTRIDGVSAAGVVPAEGDPLPAVGTVVHARLDDVRRRQLMRTHSGLHVERIVKVENKGKGFRRVRISLPA